MKKNFLFFFLLSIMLGACKKDNVQKQVCKLPSYYQEIDFYRNGDTISTTDHHLTYENKNLVREETIRKVPSMGYTKRFVCEYNYQNAEKGLLENYNLYFNNRLLEYRTFTYDDNDRLIRVRSYYYFETDTLQYTVELTYRDNHVVQLHSWNSNGSFDIITKFTYDGDDIILQESYDSNNMNTPLATFEYRYDDKKIPFFYLNTKDWPRFYVHNEIYEKYTRYENGNTHISETNIEYTYDNDGFPIKSVELDSEGRKLTEKEYSYRPCE